MRIEYKTKDSAEHACGLRKERKRMKLMEEQKIELEMWNQVMTDDSVK